MLALIWLAFLVVLSSSLLEIMVSLSQPPSSQQFMGDELLHEQLDMEFDAIRYGWERPISGLSSDSEKLVEGHLKEQAER
ncbi:hypothetical protein Pst134EA_013850 [Puccinia striiformis f. sp. tritici]|uniref:hypothetical protein n=1 Tax=Puccinia striiformis f. sp. tritici TaxID=168172 RepID=UPI002007C345|nr:hypothetical protein Pst134EA_013850 [Puccinia striiformis f. sp. tritici]KAH9465995.1 hypothetical protein Pst134EA_013850 [Puccinia striiformis f. sp. tritici]